MPFIAIVSASHCRADQVARLVAEKLEVPLALEKDILEAAASRFGASASKLEKTLSGSTSFFNNLTHEREKNVTYIKAALAEKLNTSDLVLYSRSAVMIPDSVSHVLKVHLTANMEFRKMQLMEERGLSEKSAIQNIQDDDQGVYNWLTFISKRLPWDSGYFDLTIPMHEMDDEKAAELICESALKQALSPTDKSMQSVMDFLLAVKIQVELTKKEYYYCDVEVKREEATVLINKDVLRLEHLEKEIKKLITPMEGIRSIKTKVGPNFHKTDIAMNLDLDVPTKFLLVDDEREYVLTLSERLGMRDIESDVVYDGEQALDYVRGEKPEVMVLDLRMPGMDGIEVLRRVKDEHPKTEVIILTGHGSEQDKKVVLELGAFAYLQKPVSIDTLVETMRRAHQHSKDSEGES